MKKCICCGWLGGRVMWLALALVLLRCGPASARVFEESFDVIQVGTKTYRNVTVTTKAKDYVFILHAAGMTNLKVSDLPPQVRVKLGYGDKPKGPSGVGAWARQSLVALGLPDISELRHRVSGSFGSGTPMFASINPATLLSLLGIALLVYFFFCYCCALICRKTGNPPGLLIWVPVLQIFPLLRAASMSPWWFVAWLVPVFNVLAQIVWSFKIVQARAKNAWLALLLLLPITNLFTFLYLAFSASEPAKAEPAVEIMTLDAA